MQPLCFYHAKSHHLDRADILALYSTCKRFLCLAHTLFKFVISVKELPSLKVAFFLHFFITKIFDTQKGEERMWDLVTITTTGRATADVELKTSTNGKNTKYVQFGLAVNKGYWLLGSWEGFINHTRISLFIKRTCHWWTTWICKIISWWNDANMGGCRWHSLFIMLNNPQKF